MKSRTSLFMLLAAVALTFLSSPAPAVVYYVDGQNGQDPNDGLSWDTAKATIQAAVDAASTDDEIWVKAGNYAISSQIQVDEAIGIYGGFAGDEIERSQRDWVGNVTMMDGQNSTRILQTADEPIIDGFTLINGYYDTSTDTESGGGAVYIGGVLIPSRAEERCISAVLVPGTKPPESATASYQTILFTTRATQARA